MYNEVIKAKLEFCLEHIAIIGEYTKDICSANEFSGQVYDATLMRLQALGESLKAVAGKYPQVISDLDYSEIGYVIRFRDYVSHHYELLEHEIVYNIVVQDIPELKKCLVRLIKEKYSI